MREQLSEKHTPFFKNSDIQIYLLFTYCITKCAQYNKLNTDFPKICYKNDFRLQDENARNSKHRRI